MSRFRQLSGVAVMFAVGWWCSPASAQSPAAVTKESSAAFRKVVKSALPAVVSVSAKAKQPAAKASRDGNRLRKRMQEGLTPEDFQKFLEEFDGFGGPEPDNGGFGSGVIVSPDGVVLTNNHVVGNAETAEVTLHDGKKLKSKQIITDPKTDLAIVKLDVPAGEKLPFVTFGDSDAMEIGDWVLAMGSPFGLSGTVTVGIISAKGRPLHMNVYEDFLQTDAAINPGNSGGPLINLDGQIVGINTAIRSNSGGYDGVGFSVPSNMAKEVVDHLIKHGRVKRGYLGIAMENASQAVLSKLGLKSGVTVTSLTEGETPARKAGLRAGDIVLEVEGRTIADSKALQGLVTTLPAGRGVDFKIDRDGEKKILKVTIEEQPAEFGMRTAVRKKSTTEPDAPKRTDIGQLGLAVESLTPANAEKLGVPAGAGVLVAEVEDQSPADQAGIDPGSVILQVEKKDVRSPDELKKAIEAASLKEGILLKVRNPDGSTKLIVVQKS